MNLAQIVTCRCGQKNRLEKRAVKGRYICGSCGRVLDCPFSFLKSPPSPKVISAVAWGIAILIVALLVLDIVKRTTTQPASFIVSARNEAGISASPQTTKPIAQQSKATPTIRPFTPPTVARSTPISTPSYSAPTPFQKIALPLPVNGLTLNYSNKQRVAPFEIKAAAGNNHYMKLVDAETGRAIISVFVRSGCTTEIQVPLGRYFVKYASGETWYGYQDLFGPKTFYSKATENFIFDTLGNRVRGFTITLYPVPGGNLHTEAINPADF